MRAHCQSELMRLLDALFKIIAINLFDWIQ
jgi:hypothetical protein